MKDELSSDTKKIAVGTSPSDEVRRLLQERGYGFSYIDQIVANETCYGIDYGKVGWRDVSIGAARERLSNVELIDTARVRVVEEEKLIAALEALESERPGVTIPAASIALYGDPRTAATGRAP